MSSTLDFDNAFRLYYEPLFHFARQFVADDDECYDIVSSAYETVWARRDSLEPGSVRPLLYTIVRNRCLDFLRHTAHRQQYVEYVTLMTSRFVSPEDLAERDDEQRVIRQILDDLGPPTNEILIACYINGKKYREVAKEMNISVATVKKHIGKALQLIREYKKMLNN